MEKLFAIYRLGVRYLYRYRRRYGFLLAALIFGFTIITFISSAKDGMYDSVYYAAQSNYAGDIIAVGYDNGSDQYYHHMGRNEINGILSASDRAGINPRYTVLRTLNGSDSIVYYNGAAVQLKNLIGCDWENEAHLFGKMSFEEAPGPITGDDAIILSAPTAQQLGAKTGDRITLEVLTRGGQKNTGMFIVRGIVQDTSLFGYFKAYVSRLSLNRLLLYDDGDCSTIGFFLDNPASAEHDRKLLQNAMPGDVQLGPLVYNRDEMARERDRPWSGTRIFLYTLPVYLSEISNLLNAMNIITYFLYAMMLLIILVSASVTYRLILHERTKELGTMRVIGFYGGDLRLVLWTEILVLGFISLISGFIAARILSWAVSFLSFSWFPGFQIFLKNGKLTAMYLPGTTLINVLSIFLILFAVALFPSLRVSRKNLPGLLSGEPL